MQSEVLRSYVDYTRELVALSLQAMVAWMASLDERDITVALPTAASGLGRVTSDGQQAKPGELHSVTAGLVTPRALGRRPYEA